MSRGARGARSALLLPLLLFTLPPVAVCQEPADLEITESQRRLDQIRREREELREEMTRIRTRVSDLSSELDNIQRQVGTAAGVLGELEFQLAQREFQIAQNTRDLLMTRDRLVERRAVLHRRLRDIYKRGPLPTLQVLLSAESFGDLVNRYRYLYLMARYDRQLTREVAELERQLVARERALRTNLAQLEGVRLERGEEHSLLAALQDQQRTALVNVRSRETATAARISQLERDAVRLTDLIGSLERRRADAEAAARPGAGVAAGPTVPTLGATVMGRLEWPTEGTLLYPFGRAVLPNGTAVRWNGIGIGAAEGTSVRAVAGGTVVLAGPFEGYGPTVILSHGAGYYTLYLYLRDLRVREGDEIGPGQVVGSVGRSAPGEAPHLEFQLRVPGGQAVDPLTWLRPR